MEKAELNITLRRLRMNTNIRELTANVHINYLNFIQPIFVEENLKAPRKATGLERVFVDTEKSIINTIEKDLKNGITKFLLFPIPANKSNLNFNFSFSTKIVSKLKKLFSNKIWIACDICLCSYTSHGHCGILDKTGSKIINNETLKILAKYALLLAQSGVDCVAPSDMMDGRVGIIRKTLNKKNFDNVIIMSYSSKFSSQFYGPFRDACSSSPKNTSLQNRKSYQISPFHAEDAINSALRDEAEGADILMVKPAALYTDIILRLKTETKKPIAAYHVSGEYAAIENLANKQLVNRELAHIEVWTALIRSGATIIISYAARNAKEWLSNFQY